MTHNLKLLGLVIIVAFVAFVGLSYLNKIDGEDSYFSSEKTPSQTFKDSTKPKKELTKFHIYDTEKSRKTTIINRVNDSVPLSAAEKNVILKEFSGGKGKTMSITESERMRINRALNQR